MKNISYRLAKNNKNDREILYSLSIDFEKFNQKGSSRPEEHFKGDWPTYFKEEIISSLKNKNSWVFLALEGKIPVGFLFCRICKGCYYFTIEELFVKDEYRGVGAGKKLVELALKEGAKHEYPIRVEVFDWNKGAIEFYKRNGFNMDSVIMAYNQD